MATEFSVKVTDAGGSHVLSDDGQEVLFIQSARSKWDLRDGTLWIWGPMLRLVVECQDEAGSTDVDVATVRLRRGLRIN